MQLKKKDIYLLMILAGILIALGVYQFVYIKYQEKCDALEAENDSLQNTVTELELLEARRQEFEDDTQSMQAECDRIIRLFNADTMMEDEIMYTYNMEQVVANDIAVPSVTLAGTVELPYSGSLSVGEYQLTDEGIRMFDSSVNLGFTTSYDGLKHIIEYLYDMPGRKALSTVSVALSGDGYLSCSAVVDFYHLTGTEMPYEQSDIPTVILGTDNIFGVLETAPPAENAGESEAGEAE